MTGLTLVSVGLMAAIPIAADTAPNSPATGQSVIVVVGAAGTPEYRHRFQDWAARWQQAARSGGGATTLIGLADPDGTRDLDRVREAVHAGLERQRPTWIVLIGHGTFDGANAKFNLRGPDLSAEQLAAWLAATDGTDSPPVAVVNCTSASGPFLAKLSAPGRVIVTATKSGQEIHFARFGEFLSRAIADPRNDLDKDHQVSLLEAWLRAVADVNAWYEAEGRLATEHSLLDDNGDGQGSRADWYHGIVAKQPGVDGARANQFCLQPSPRERLIPVELRQRRDELELTLADIRDRRNQYDEDQYYGLLEPILVELSELGEQIDASASLAGLEVPERN